MGEVTPQTEARVLAFFVAEEFLLPAEIDSVVALWEGSAANAGALVSAWVQRGWLEVLSQDDPQLPPLLHLTTTGYEEFERRQSAA